MNRQIAEVKGKIDNLSITAGVSSTLSEILKRDKNLENLINFTNQIDLSNIYKHCAHHYKHALQVSDVLALPHVLRHTAVLTKH